MHRKNKEACFQAARSNKTNPLRFHKEKKHLKLNHSFTEKKGTVAPTEITWNTKCPQTPDHVKVYQQTSLSKLHISRI